MSQPNLGMLAPGTHVKREVNMEESKQCCCCECKAKYYVAGDYVCGRHLAYIVDCYLRIGPNSAKVTKAEE